MVYEGGHGILEYLGMCFFCARAAIPLKLLSAISNVDVTNLVYCLLSDIILVLFASTVFVIS